MSTDAQLLSVLCEANPYTSLVAHWHPLLERISTLAENTSRELAGKSPLCTLNTTLMGLQAPAFWTCYTHWKASSTCPPYVTGVCWTQEVININFTGQRVYISFCEYMQVSSGFCCWCVMEIYGSFPSLQCVFGAREHHRQWMLCTNHVCLRHIQELSDSEGTYSTTLPPPGCSCLWPQPHTCLCALAGTMRLRTIVSLTVKHWTP